MSAEVVGIVAGIVTVLAVLGTTIYQLITWVKALVDSRIEELKTRCADADRERDFWKDETIKTKEELRENAKRNADNQEATTRSLRASADSLKVIEEEVSGLRRDLKA